MYFKQLEQTIFENAGWAEDCSREHVVNALLALDPEMTDRTVMLRRHPAWLNMSRPFLLEEESSPGLLCCCM